MLHRQTVKFALILGLALAASPAPVSPERMPEQTGPWRWETDKERNLALIGPAGEIWRFRCDPGLDHAYFHSLSTVEGRVLTADRPPDHIWHHGLWFSWKYIDKVNYWEVDAASGRPAGRTTWTIAAMETRADRTARLVLDLDYRPAGADRPVLIERRTIEVSAPGLDGVYFLDWTAEYQAAKDLVLDRTPLLGEPGGQINGGYAGLALRLAGGLEDLRLVTDQGPAGEFTNDRYRGRHTGLDYAGQMEGEPAGIAILDHPQNPRAPTAWYAVHSAVMAFFNPALLSPGPLTLRNGERMTLRYRILIHPGRWDAARLKAEALRFANVR
ncbi:MAG: PmoA family protein [Acidobacteriota bacterium]|nr:PmoA family protein [Acidobacteriota bacterium]